MLFLNDFRYENELQVPDVGELTVIKRTQQAGCEDAKRLLLSGARGKYVAYSDDDVFYWPGWFDASKAILDAIGPCVVSCCPSYAIIKAYSATEKGLGGSPVRSIPHEWNLDWAKSIGGGAPNEHLERMIETGGVKAYLGAHHLQFTTNMAYDLAKVIPRGDFIMQGGGEFDRAQDVAGVYRLCTTERYALHIGNVLDGTPLEEAKRLGYT